MTGIPPGLTILKKAGEERQFKEVVENTKKQTDVLLNVYSQTEFLQKAQAKYEVDLKKDIKNREDEHSRYIAMMEEEHEERRKEFKSRTNDAEKIKKLNDKLQKEIDDQKVANEKELKKIRRESLKEYQKGVQETQHSLSNLNDSLEKSLKSYTDTQKQIAFEVKKLKDSGASDEEIAAYLKRNDEILAENTREMTSALDKVKDELVDLSKNENIDAQTKFMLKKQLIALEKSYDLEETYSNKQLAVFEEMNEDLTRLRESQEETDKREKRKNKKDFKSALLEIALGPFNAIADPLLKAFKGNDIKGILQERTEKSEAKDEIYEKARKDRNKVDEEERVKNLLAAREEGIDTSPYERPSIASVGMKALRTSFTPKALLSGLKDSIGFGEKSFEDYAEKEDRQDAKDALFRSKGFPITMLKSLFTRNKQGTQTVPITEDSNSLALPPSTASAPLALPSPDAEESALEQGLQVLPITEDLYSNKYETDPMLERIAPDAAVLLAKGGVVGAGVVFLARKLGLITDKLEDNAIKNNNKDNDGGGIFKKAGGKLPALLGNAIAVAIPLALAAGAVALQKRDTEDAKKHFEKGDKARGVETFIMGDRERITEETANYELGRATGKAALAGGAVAGGVAAGGFIASGGAAAAGAAATAAGAGLGGASIAATGAALAAVVPPVLIGAAIAATAMVIAKGTQEAFELGWDKNQATIQKELTETMLSDDATTMQKIKAGATSTWKGFTGKLAGGIREAGKVLDAETMIQNEKQINFIKEQAEANSESHQRLLELMQSEQFEAMNEVEQKAAMQAEGLYDEYQGAKKATRKNIGEHLTTVGRTVGGVFTGINDTTVEAKRGKKTAVWEKAALKGMENMSVDDIERFQQSDAYKKSMSENGSRKEAMEAAYLEEARKKAVARGDLRKDGTAIQSGDWREGMIDGAATGGIFGVVPGTLGGAFGKYLGQGDTGLTYKERKTGTDELDAEYKQTFEFKKRKAELIGQGMDAEKADLAIIEEQNALYEEALNLRLKQSKDYKQTFDEQTALGLSNEEAEEIALKAAKDNKKNTMTTMELITDPFKAVGTNIDSWTKKAKASVKQKITNIGDKFLDITQNISGFAKGIWEAVSEWFSGIFKKIGDAVKAALGKVGEGWDWLKGKAGDAGDWLLGGDSADVAASDDAIEDGIVTKDGKVIELSPDDNVYATKNEPKVIRDQEAQRAMPDVPRTPAEFTDTGIIKAIQLLTDVLIKKNMEVTVASPGESVNFDQFRMADVLV